MAILNYTTTIAAQKTIGEIIALLARHGAQSISQQFAAGVPTGVAFTIQTAYGLQEYVLPVNRDGVHTTMQKQWNAGRLPGRYANREQAERVAWRITKDWLEAQLALIEVGLVSLDQVMMPYMQIDGRPAYQIMRENLLQIPERAGVGR